MLGWQVGVVKVGSHFKICFDNRGFLLFSIKDEEVAVEREGGMGKDRPRRRMDMFTHTFCTF